MRRQDGEPNGSAGGEKTVVSAVERDLADLAKRDNRLSESTLAMSALALAREMDSDSSATSKSMCARALLETMDRLWELSPAEKEASPLDEIRARRESRTAARVSNTAN